MNNPARPQNHVSRETFDEFAESQFVETRNSREVDGVGEFYRDEVDAPSALLTRMRVAAQERGEAPLNAFSANKIMRDFGAVMSGTASKKKSRRAQGWDRPRRELSRPQTPRRHCQCPDSFSRLERARGSL